MYPIDAMTDSELNAYERYIENAFGGRGENEALKNVSAIDSLSEWNKSKIRLFKAFGRKLRVSYEIEVDEKIRMNEIVSELLRLYDISGPVPTSVKQYMELAGERFNPLLCSVYDFYNKTSCPICAAKIFQLLLAYRNVASGYISNEDMFKDWNFQKNELYVPNNGDRTIRAIRKFLSSIGYFDGVQDGEFLFEKFRNDVSDIITNVPHKMNITISIHPLDFLSISDNNNGWTSCMSLNGNGCCRNGVISLMNSNMSLVCYMSCSKEYDMCGEMVPSKAWRAIGYATKDIVVIGKPYPNDNRKLVGAALDLARKTFEENVGWHYKYLNQPYRDMATLQGNEYAARWIYENKSSIVLYSGIEFYNDIAKDVRQEYLCCRNWVPKRLDMNVTGKLTCLRCGKPLYSQSVTSYAKNGYTLFPQSMYVKLDDFKRPICKECEEDD